MPKRQPDLAERLVGMIEEEYHSVQAELKSDKDRTIEETMELVGKCRQMQKIYKRMALLNSENTKRILEGITR